MSLVDTIYTYRFLKILSTPWIEQDAFKLGIIDKDGTVLRKLRTLKTDTDKNAYTPFHRLAWNIKRLVGKMPGGKTRVANYASALYLIKEQGDHMGIGNKAMDAIQERLKILTEEPTNVIGDAGENDNIKTFDPKLGKTQRRKKKELDEDEDDINEGLPPHLAKHFKGKSEVIDRTPSFSKGFGITVAGKDAKKAKDYLSSNKVRHTSNGGSSFKFTDKSVFKNIEAEFKKIGIKVMIAEDDYENRKKETPTIVNESFHGYKMSKVEGGWQYGEKKVKGHIINLTIDGHGAVLLTMKRDNGQTVYQRATPKKSGVLELEKEAIQKVIPSIANEDLLDKEERMDNQEATREKIAKKKEDAKKEPVEESLDDILEDTEERSAWDIIKESMTRRKKKNKATGKVEKFYKNDKKAPPGKEKNRKGGFDKRRGNRKEAEVKKTKRQSAKKFKKTMKKRGQSKWNLSTMRRKKTMRS